MKKIIKIWLIALAVCGLLGLGLLLVGYAMGGSFYEAVDLASVGPFRFRFDSFDHMHHMGAYWGDRDDWDDWEDQDDWEDHGHGEWKGCRGGHTRRPGHADRISGLKLDLSGMEGVSITYGDGFDLFVQGPDDHLKSYVDEGVWHIESTKHRSRSRVKIQLPRDAEFDKVEIDLAAAMFHADALRTESLELDMAAGSARMDGLDCRELEVDMVAGELELNGSVSRKADIDLTAGSCTLTMPRPEDYTYSIDSGIGSVSVDGQGFEGIGREISKTGSGPHFEVNCAAGAVDISFEDVL